MKKLILLFILNLAISATQIFPIPMKKQLNEADGVILGEYLGQVYKKNHEGKILTEASFKILKSAGIGNRYLVNRNVFTVHYEGGEWQELVYDNPNAPRFALNSQYVILVQRDSFGFKPYYDKLGVYDYEGRGDQYQLISMAFPDHPNLGKIPYRSFDIWVRTTFGDYLEDYRSDKYVFEDSKKELGRAIASYEDEKASESSSVNILWFSVLFGVIGAMRMRRVKTWK
ncbi:hypothetical protein [Bacteriovorax sp. Seq25_V]|uniref:hypothetical protein n=1 Tax=Bacteriovorax sp. Seq25_V TaxID=1201288 RepID=UPI00038A1FB0|nr:hypothetical protein [Bacteriovorax sp. Seq25_V]EQC43307.1 hypothetical protein M900_0210 [Bacteriovorax sp. Seq25_V]